jgi:type VI secretion system protein VasD
VCLLVACAAKPPKPPPPALPVKLTISAGADVNPDAQNRASPIVVRLYLLKEDAAFRAADFYALYEKDQATLGGALVSREDFEFAPGEHHSEELNLPKDARFIGVVAAYRDLRNADWRAVASLADLGVVDLTKKNAIAIALDRTRIRLSKAD